MNSLEVKVEKVEKEDHKDISLDVFDFEKLLELPTDFDLKVRTVLFKVHRAILSLKSQYFRTLLSGKLVTAQESQVTLPDTIFPEDFNKVLLFFYNEELLTIDSSNIASIMFIADYLDVQTLIQQGAKYLLKEVKCNNQLENQPKKLFETLLLAQKFRLHQVVDACVEPCLPFITEKIDPRIVTEWNQLSANTLRKLWCIRLHKWQVKDHVDAQDKSGQWYEARILEAGLKYRVTFAGFSTNYDEWINPQKIALSGTKRKH